MRLSGRIGWCGVMLGAVLAGGCATDPRTSNQGGGSLLTAANKAAKGNLAALTPDEWQILADNAPSLASQFGIALPVAIPTLTDEDAQNLADCAAQSNVSTFDALENLESFNIPACQSLASLF